MLDSKLARLELAITRNREILNSGTFFQRKVKEMTKTEQNKRDAYFGRMIREFIQGKNYATIDSFATHFPTPTIENYNHETCVSIRMLRNGGGKGITIETSFEGENL